MIRLRRKKKSILVINKVNLGINKRNKVKIYFTPKVSIMKWKPPDRDGLKLIQMGFQKLIWELMLLVVLTEMRN